MIDINYFGDLGLLQNYGSNILMEVYDRDLLVRVGMKL